MPGKYSPFEGTGIEDQPARPPEPVGGPSGTFGDLFRDGQAASAGLQKILVDLPGARRLYTYVIRGPVKAGDRVIVPGPPWAPDTEQSGTVKQLGSDYTGPTVEARLAR
jgi:hypothetical protein